MKQRCWFLLTLFLFSTPIVRAGDWYSWRGPEQNGVSRETDLPSKFSEDPKEEGSNLVWKAPYGTRSTPIVMNGRVYFINQSGEKINEQERVICLDEKTGEKIWERRFNVFHTDIVSVRLGWGNLAGDPKTEKLYWHGTQGLFVCFDKDGKILWSKSMTEEFGRVSGYGGRVNSPTIDGDLVILGMPNFSWGDQAAGAIRYFGMNKHNGEVLWTWQSPNKVKDSFYSNPVIAVINGQRLLITGGGDGYLHALKVRNGEHVWSYRITDGGLNTSPVVEGNRVFITHGAENFGTGLQGGVFCVDASEVKDGQPKLVWKRYNVIAKYTSPIVKDGRLYVCTDIARMECLDTKTGQRIWRRPLAYGRNAKGSPVLADGKIYVGAVDAEFSIIDPSGTRPKVLHRQFFRSPDGIVAIEINGTPAVANGRVFFGTSEAFYCIGKKEWGGKAGEIPPMPEEAPLGKPASVRIEPSEVTIHPGDTDEITVSGMDENVRLLETNTPSGEWSIPTPTTPPK
ncbi:MAG: PQQ-binding-like beta-propeller repeat protein [Gemmataceae bacterium]